jgi:hypothetical protein
MSESMDTIKEGLQRDLPPAQAQVAIDALTRQVDSQTVRVPDPPASPIREVAPGQVTAPAKPQVVNVPPTPQRVNGEVR